MNARAASTAGVRAANRAALLTPSVQGFNNAIQIYAYSEGALFQLFAAPDRVSDIMLEAGEQLISVSAGDTTRWIVADTTSSSGPNRRVHVLVKPVASGLRTNLLINTDRRAYHLALESTQATAMVGVAWRYPQDQLANLASTLSPASALPPPPPSNALAQTVTLALGGLNFGYEIEGAHPPWRPVRAFDDGARVFIELPPSQSTAAPPLLVADDRGCPVLINYQLVDNHYIVERLFDLAELRAGGAGGEVVKIRSLRTPANRARSRLSGSARRACEP